MLIGEQYFGQGLIAPLGFQKKEGSEDSIG